MKTTHLIALTATIVACTAATASARPAVEPPGSQASEPSAATSASIAAHREQISNEQWQRSQAQPAPAPLTDRTATDDGFPLGLVLLGVTRPARARLPRRQADRWATPGTGATRRASPDHGTPTGPGGLRPPGPQMHGDQSGEQIERNRGQLKAS